MAQNTSPIFTHIPKITFAQITATDNTSDGTGANVALVFTADSTDGSYIQKLMLIPRTTATTSTSFIGGTVRVYINNGSTPGTGTNNSLIKEMQIPATNVEADNGIFVAIQTYEIPLNIQLPASYRIYVGFNTTNATAMTANTILQITSFGGDY